MNEQKEHRITVKITGADSFKLPVAESEESFYRGVIENINRNIHNLCVGNNAEVPTVALAKVALYYATILYRQTSALNNQAKLLRDFEERIDKLLEGTD
ncbi:MAG: hypothetical protein HDT06_05860 [Bacteroidales bacterium]|nr:hypothetical protein [Bacteroidales bacterium]MBD5219195.1 hypothetical protein [Bacteroidales bacterium]